MRGLLVRPVLLTREYPPEVYGGAGVHVEYLARELGRLVTDVEVHCFGATRPADGPPVRAYRAVARLGGTPTPRSARAGGRPRDGGGARRRRHRPHPHLVRQLRRPLGKLLYGIPHVVTSHSLEPQRPWKAEQLGGGYRALVLGRAHRLRGAPTR